MLIILPLICFLLFFLIFWVKTDSWRDAALFSSVLCGLLVTAGTEFLSALNSIDFNSVAGLWGLSCLVGMIVLGLTLSDKKAFPKLGSPRFCYSEYLLLFGGVAIVAIVGLVALIAPPNTWDSMVYHMSRVVHWIQDRNVAFYPTPILRQLHQNPWAEFAIMHLQILSGSDRFANLVQWFSMVGSAIGVSLIAKLFGADRQRQIISAVITATIPMGILQGSSTQTDYVVSFWLVCFVYFLMSFKERPKWIYSLAAGAGLGLAVLTKATAYVYALPFFAWLALSLIKSLRWKSWQPLIVIMLMVLLTNLGHYIRNYDLYGNPLGPGQEDSSDTFRYANDIFTVSSVVSNSLRNLALHVGTPVDQINTEAENGITFLHTLLQIDVNDPRTTWGNARFHVPRLSTHESDAGNPLHLVLIFVSLGLYLIIPSARRRELGLYAFVLVMAFLLFSLYLRWQPWNSRLHLPLFVLWSPFVALTLASVGGARFGVAVSFVLMLLTIPWLVHNQTRPLVGRGSILVTDRVGQYFENSPGLREPYVEAADLIKSQGCSRIGLVLGWDDWEYPFWVLLKQDNAESVRIEDVGVDNISAAKEAVPYFSNFTPCVVVRLGQDQSTLLSIRQDTYTLKWSSGPVSLFVGE